MSARKLIGIELAFALAFSSYCWAQPRAAMRGPSRLDSMLLSAPEIQSELKLTGQQRDLLEALSTDVFAQRTRDLDARRKLAEVASRIRKTILDKEQTARLTQLRVQFQGLYAVDDDEFSKGLDLSSDQVDEIRRLRRNDNPIDVTKVLGKVLADDQLNQWQARAGDAFEFADETLMMRNRFFRFSRRFRPGRPR